MECDVRVYIVNYEGWNFNNSGSYLFTTDTK